MDETLRLLARMMDGAERGNPEVEAHLAACGWEYVGGRYRSPDELATAPRCRHCGRPFFADEPFWRDHCLVIGENGKVVRDGEHEPLPSGETGTVN